MSDVPNSLREAAPARPMPDYTTATTPVAPTAFAVRMWCAFVFVMCAGMLGVGLWLKPSPAGSGTHTQLGLPPCGFFMTTGYPCPTCGCTTAVSHLAHGEVVASVLTQPFGFAVGMLAVVLLPLTGLGVVMGKWYGPSMFTLGWYWRRWVYGGLAIFVLGYVYKIISVRMGHG